MVESNAGKENDSSVRWRNNCLMGIVGCKESQAIMMQGGEKRMREGRKGQSMLVMKSLRVSRGFTQTRM